MAGIYQRLVKLWPRGGGAAATHQAELLRVRLAARYQSYRQLLKANSRALICLAELQAASQQTRPPSMPFLRSRAAEAALAAFQMIRELETLSGRPEPELMDCFERVWSGLDELLEASSTPAADGPLIMDLADSGGRDAALVGPKMAQLASLGARFGLRVPRGFVVTSRAYRLFVEHNDLRPEINRRLQLMEGRRLDALYAASSALQRVFLEGSLPPHLALELEAASLRLAEGRRQPARLAVRSSALGEDAGGASFAGQFTSLLGVPAAELGEAYKEVIASAYGPQALSYYLAHGLRDQDLAMAVGFLEMVEARAGGVAYSTSPTHLDESGVHISACWGLPKGVVEGGQEAQHLVVTAQGQVRHRAGRQSRAYRLADREGIEAWELPHELSRASPLRDDQARELAEAVRRLERELGGPVDVEWALDQAGGLVYLQCRELLLGDTPQQAPSPPLKLPALLIAGGVAASRGTAAGRVRWVRRGQDALTFESGEVLAVERPLPRWAPLLDRAAAVLAEEGGVAGHLATVAREYGVPALFGLGRALAGLADGQEVTVDASGLAVYPGRLSELASFRRVPAAAATPVFRTLEAVLGLLAPIHLLDPEEPGFKAGACRTLHDLVRYCHQLGVEAMFRAGHQGEFPAPVARRLYYGRPMQWLVLDLGGGTKELDDVRYVKPEEIVCPAWHALWEGMLAVPWEGPPISAAGLGSVIMESTMRPDAGGGGKRRREGNYFLIGADYLHLQSKIGVHFAGVEALTGPEREENFLSFFFQGGAADLGRQTSRLELMGELLEERGFGVEIRGDAARARLESPGQEEALTRLRGLGYLLMHLRQLDMAMGDPVLAARYRDKMRRELRQVEGAG